jgi:[acyl-carrier-protein] S-malonyltransferase
VAQRQIAFVYPGQGSQHAGMGAELLADAEVAELAQRCSIDVDLRHLLTEADDEQLKLTENAQPALCFTGIALTLLLRRDGVEPAATAGHSVGEYAALAAAGAIEPEDAVATVVERGHAMAEAVPAGETGLSAVLGLDPEAVVKAIGPIDGCWPANYNTPTQTVIGGTLKALDEAARALKDAGARRVVSLNVSAAFHTPVVAPAAERLRRRLDTLSWRPPERPVMSNLSGSPYPPDAQFPDALERQLKSPVRWSDCVHALQELGATDFVEVGPKRALTSMLRELAPRAGAHSVASPAAVEDLAARLIQ